MDLSLFDYNLPPELIAQEPLSDRAGSRMLVLDRAVGQLAHRLFRDLPGYLGEGDVLVVNDTRVFPARLRGRLEDGGRVELLLLRSLGDGVWEALARPGRRLRTGSVVTVADGRSVGLVATVVGAGERGARRVRLDHEGDLSALLERIGSTPLPPYIRRAESDADRAACDRERYQTVYAARDGAVAAPTAGLHFDAATLAAVESAGAEIARVTLHVGAGTFRPVRAAQIERHEMDAEWYEISPEAAEALRRARRVVAVGTTVVRAVESATGPDGRVEAGEGWTNLFITPGYRFKRIGALLTNFHLPRSTLLMLVSAFAGREQVLEAYAEAISARYRFYSYGDCMLLL